MVGRNDPCLCGSGKKYKKCCLGKNEESLETLIDDELERVLRGIYQQSRTRAEMNRYERYQSEWNQKLGDYWDAENINVAATEYFLFVEQQKQWEAYIEAVLEGSLRDSVRSVVEMWKEPVVVFGKVKQEEDGILQVEEVQGEETFTIEVRESLEEEGDVIAFGIALRDNRRHQDGLYTLSSFIFIKDLHQAFENDVVDLMASNEKDSNLAFYQTHMLDVYEKMFDRDDNMSTEDLIDTKLEEEQQEALTILEEVLDDVEATSEMKEFLQNVGITYFIKETPRFRKPNVIAAAVFNVALDLEVLGELTMTNREIADRFDVSTSSIKPHADRIHVFVKEMLEQTQETV